jgi:hypothetical protein
MPSTSFRNLLLKAAGKKTTTVNVNSKPAYSAGNVKGKQAVN